MIAIVRMKAQEKREELWDSVLMRFADFQRSLLDQGRLLYLSKRAKHEDVSLFLHVKDCNVLGAFIAEHVCRVPDVTGIHMIHLVKPIFFQIPRDTAGLKRYAITLRVFPPHLESVYGKLAQRRLPEGLIMAYVAYTFHLFGDYLQFSVLATPTKSISEFVSENVAAMPGVLHTTVNFVEKTKPLISYNEWREYSRRFAVVPTWNERNMIAQFSC